MTPDERDKFVDFIAKEKEADEASVAGKEKATVALHFQHHINGVKLGPGNSIEVPCEWVGMLQRAENNMRDHELRMLTSTYRNFEVLQSGQSIERPKAKR